MSKTKTLYQVRMHGRGAPSVRVLETYEAEHAYAWRDDDGEFDFASKAEAAERCLAETRAGALELAFVQSTRTAEKLRGRLADADEMVSAVGRLLLAERGPEDAT